VELATRLAVRTADDGRQREVRDLEPEVGRDPAFEYLAARPAELTRLSHADRRWIDRLLDGTEGRPRIGVNIRPIRHLYTVGAGGADADAFTRATESRFEAQLAQALRRFHDEVEPKPCFVFYPMNAIQFGLSDLRSAYRIARCLRGNVEFRVWEGDASVDGVVALLRRLDIIVAMRFHATIFALAQERPVIGIDYRIGKRDKVASLLGDFEQNENCTRIDELTADWLCGRLRALWGTVTKGTALRGTDEE
jgi:polysaccharide pyruvyl transferase WcaK-like protein